MPVPSPQAGEAGKPVQPAKPTPAKEAAKADPGSNDIIQRAPINKTPLTEEEKKRKCSWIEIELIGDDGKPYPGEAYEVRQADGSVSSGTLDENGFAHVRNLEPGSPEITFPNLDKEAWESA